MNEMASIEVELGPRPPAQTATVALQGEVGDHELVELFGLLFDFARKGSYQVVLDFSEVTHFDYRGVKPLIARASCFRTAGGDIKLCGLSPYLTAIFRSAGAHDAFDVFGAAPEARAAFQRAVFVAG
ncbi:MAG: STAS domain-containing protein [Myxococcota bacterium]